MGEEVVGSIEIRGDLFGGFFVDVEKGSEGGGGTHKGQSGEEEPSQSRVREDKVSKRVGCRGGQYSQN